MNLTIQIGVYAEKNEKFNSLPKNVEFSSIQEMATYLDLESAKYKDDPLLLVRLKDGSQPHLIDYKSNYALRNFIKEVAEHYFNLQNHIPMSENNIIGGKISEIAEKVVNGEYEDFKKFDKNTQNIILMYIEKSERSNRLEVLSDVWNSEITHPSALSKGMTVSQIDEKANNYYSSHRSFQNQQNEINMENQKLSFWDKNITPLTNKYKNFIKEMENTPSEIFYRDGKREFTEQEKKFMEIYKYKEIRISNTSETATILNKIENDSSFFQELPEELKQNKNFVYEAVSRNLTTLQFVSDEFKNDKDLLKMAVKQYGKLIQYASAELRNNKEVVLEAVKSDGFALEYVSNELKNDREVVLEAVKSDGFALRFASDELRNDKEIALEAIKQNKRNLQYVSDELKNDKDFILEVLQQNGIALEYASAELRNNKEVVLEAVKQNGFALRFASTELQNDKSLALEAVKQNGLVLQYLPEELRNDREVVLEAVKQNGFVLQFASDELRNDKEVILETVRNTGLALEYASPEFKNKKSLVIEMVKQDGFALHSVSAELRNDREVVLEAVKQNGFALEFASTELQNDKSLALEAVKQNGLVLQSLPEELRNDREVVLEAVKQNGKALEYVSKELRNDKEIIQTAEKQMKQEKIYSVSFRSYNPEILEFSSEKPEVLDLTASELKEVINEKKKSFTDNEELSISVDGLRIDVQWDAKIEEIMAKISNNEKANELITKIQKELTPEEKVFLREKFIEEINPNSTAKNVDNPFYIDNDSKEKVNAFDKEIREISANYENYIDTIDRVLVKWESNEQLRNETSPVYIEITKRNQNEINQKNIMDEKVESLIGMVANNKVNENVGYKVKLFNELTNEEKSFFKENAKNIAIENIEEIQEGISEEEKQSISQKFDTFFKHIEQDSKKSIEQNEVVNYLKNQLKYLGFGESDDLHRKLQDGVQNTKEKDYFQIEVKSDKALQGNEANFSLNFYKSEKGGVFLNSFKGELKDSKGELKTHSFGVNNFTAKEAVNLLEGRAVKTQFTNKNTGEMEDVFVKLKLNEEKNEFGNYKMQVYNKNYGINTKDIVEKSKLIFSGEDAEKIKDLVIKSLEKGNVVNVRFKNDSNQEMNGKAVLNPQYKNINLYDEQMNRVNTNKPIQGLEADKQQEKNNVREQSRVRSHH